MNAVMAVTALAVSATGLFAQTASDAATTSVLATLTIKPGIERSQRVKIMPEEVRATVQLYLDGKIQQWFSRSDGKGVVFIMNCSTVAEAKALTDTLPLSKAGFATFEYTALGPLGPLRYLLADPKP